MTMPVDVFVSYAPADEGLWRELQKHLSMLERTGVIRTWGAHKIDVGENWRDVVQAHLNSARVILLLLSADFFASDHCYDIEVEGALALAHEGKARVIPIRVRPYDWGAVPFERLRMLPVNGLPVTNWPNPEDAWAEVAREIRLAIWVRLPEPRIGHDAGPSGEILFRSWNRATASDCVLEQLRNFGGVHEYGLGDPWSDACDVSHEVLDFLYLKYLDHAAYIAVAVTRTNPPNNCHAAAPALSFIEFIETPHGWRLGTVHANALQAGAWGHPPSKIIGIEIGYNMFAIAIDGGFTNQGCTYCYTLIYTTVTGEFKEVFNADTLSDDSLSGLPARNRWSAEIEVVRGGTSFYDLIVRRRGLQDGRTFNETQLYRFDGRAYAPADLYR
jgi:hypothetical protein